MEDKGDWELSGVRTYKNWPMIFLSSHFPFHKDQKLVFQKLWRLLMPTSGWKHMTLQWALHQFKIKFCIKKLEILIFLQDDLGFPAGPMVKNTPANARFQVWSLGWEVLMSHGVLGTWPLAGPCSVEGVSFPWRWGYGDARSCPSLPLCSRRLTPGQDVERY